MILSVEKIVMMANDINVTLALQKYITSYVLNNIDPTNILLYGPVQSGKTKRIMNILEDKEYKSFHKVLVLQNSLLVLKQYIQRLNDMGIKIQIIDNTTLSINSDVVTIVIGNKYRYAHFQKLYNNQKFMLILDESDTHIGNPLVEHSFLTYHVTATPFNYQMHYFNKVETYHSIRNYYGINSLLVKEIQDEFVFVDQFVKSSNPGMLLTTTLCYVNDMKLRAEELSKKYRNVPIVLLTGEKSLFLNSKVRKLKGSISTIIDSLCSYDKIIFVANKLARRGLSYTSSDFSRHLTHQLVNVGTNLTSFIQSLRLLGVYEGKNTLTLGVNAIKRFERYQQQVEWFDVNCLLK
jgi:hypothetical protein